MELLVLLSGHLLTLGSDGADTAEIPSEVAACRPAGGPETHAIVPLTSAVLSLLQQQLEVSWHH